ncbi:MAG: hypothetical protein U1E76_02395 [Planctomycetota bacterium]
MAEAAKALGVGEEQIFDGIRGGRVRVRFEPVPGAETERPLVTSEEIQRRADVQGYTEGELKGTPQDKAVVAAAKVTPPPAADAYSHEELEGLRRELGDAEDKLDQSLRSLYERDVKIARLESQLEAAGKVEAASHQYSQRLEERLGHLEQSAEDKEKEIRRLALTLGEARGEIKLLRGPTDVVATPPAWAFWLRFVIPVLALAAGFTTYHLASNYLYPHAGIVAALAVLLTPLLNLIPRQ